MGRDEELKTRAGELASLAAYIVREKHDKPGVWDFLQPFEDMLAVVEIEARIAENKLASTSEAAHQARELYRFKRGNELEAELIVAQAKKGKIVGLRGAD